MLESQRAQCRDVIQVTHNADKGRHGPDPAVAAAESGNLTRHVKVFGLHADGHLSPGDRWKERHFVAWLDLCIGPRNVVIDRDAHGASGCKLLRPSSATCTKP